jgi:alanyl-tRNA synthetase
MEANNPKNYDPAMHTTEHILNKTMSRLYNCERSKNSHIEKKKSKCDYKLPQALTENEISSIEKNVNDIIIKQLPIVEEFMPREEANKKFNLSRLPDSAGDILRIINVGEYDACPCNGVHVANTSKIGKFKIVSHSYENNIERIRFKITKL